MYDHDCPVCGAGRERECASGCEAAYLNSPAVERLSGPQLQPHEPYDPLPPLGLDTGSWL